MVFRVISVLCDLCEVWIVDYLFCEPSFEVGESELANGTVYQVNGFDIICGV